MNLFQRRGRPVERPGAAPITDNVEQEIGDTPDFALTEVAEGRTVLA
jgi:hypothetical protein